MRTNILTVRKAFNLFLLVFQSSIVGLSISAPIKSEDTLVEVAHLVAVVGLVILSPREHHRSVSPSTSLVVYLSTRTFFNVSALLLVHDRGTITIQVLRTIIEAANLVVESQNKKYFLLEPFLDLAPEETAGPWSKASFAWVASILFTGKDTTFSLETLPQNPQRFNPSNLRQNILLAWDQRGKLFRVERMHQTDRFLQRSQKTVLHCHRSWYTVLCPVLLLLQSQDSCSSCSAMLSHFS